MTNRIDPFALWVVSGIIAVIVRDTYSFFAKLVGFADFYIWNVGSSLLVNKPDIETFWGTVAGLLVDLTVGGMFGIIMGLLIEWRGQQHYMLKGLGVGLFAWLCFYGILYHNLPFTTGYAPAKPLSNISAFIGHSIFGITMALVYVKYFYKKYIGANEKKTNANKISIGANKKTNETNNELTPQDSPTPPVIILNVKNLTPSLWKKLNNMFVRTKH